MEITIEEHIKRMGDIRSNYDRWSGLGLTPNEARAFDFAIEAMCKYQKIEEIYNNEYKKFKIGDRGFSKEVRKVLENGNDV